MNNPITNSVTVTNWLRCMVSTLPRGGKSLAAEQLGISPSALSKILSNPERAFDEKTIRLLSWIESSKSELYPIEQFPVLKITQQGPIAIEKRQNPAGSPFYTWRKFV